MKKDDYDDSILLESDDSCGSERKKGKQPVKQHANRPAKPVKPPAKQSNYLKTNDFGYSSCKKSGDSNSELESSDDLIDSKNKKELAKLSTKQPLRQSSNRSANKPAKQQINQKRNRSVHEQPSNKKLKGLYILADDQNKMPVSLLKRKSARLSTKEPVCK